MSSSKGNLGLEFFVETGATELRLLQLLYFSLLSKLTSVISLLDSIVLLLGTVPSYVRRTSDSNNLSKFSKEITTQVTLSKHFLFIQLLIIKSFANEHCE